MWNWKFWQRTPAPAPEVVEPDDPWKGSPFGDVITPDDPAWAILEDAMENGGFGSGTYDPATGEITPDK